MILPRLERILHVSYDATMRYSQREVSPMHNLSFMVQVFKEGDLYVAHVPQLDISSCGETKEKARANIQDAVRGFIEAAGDKGTLDEILEEAGFERVGSDWNAPEVSVDRVTMTV
jgi:predicted RNase H-like HicB family nuclease